MIGPLTGVGVMLSKKMSERQTKAGNQENKKKPWFYRQSPPIKPGATFHGLYVINKRLILLSKLVFVRLFSVRQFTAVQSTTTTSK